MEQLDERWRLATRGPLHRTPTIAGDCSSLSAASDPSVIETKGNYADLLALFYSPDSLADKWAKQADKQVEAAGGRRVEWYFHDAAAAVLARKTFTGKLSVVGIHLLPHPDGVPKPNPRVR